MQCYLTKRQHMSGNYALKLIAYKHQEGAAPGVRRVFTL